MNFYNELNDVMQIPEGTVTVVGKELGVCGFDKNLNLGNTVCVSDESVKHARTIVLPDSVRYIGPKAFENATNLEKLILSKNLEVIKLSAFLNCNNLKQVFLPSSLKTIETWAFRNLDEVSYDGSIFDFDNLNLKGAFGFINRLICNDCTVDFTNEKYFIDSLEYKGTKEEFQKTYKNSWINRRTRFISYASA